MVRTILPPAASPKDGTDQFYMVPGTGGVAAVGPRLTPVTTAAVLPALPHGIRLDWIEPPDSPHIGLELCPTPADHAGSR